MKKNFFFLIVLFSFNSQAVFGQIDFADDPALAQKVKERKLAVVYDELYPDEVDLYRSKDMLELVQLEFKQRNEKCLKYFKENWQFGEVVAKTELEADQLQTAGSSEYVYVRIRRAGEALEKELLDSKKTRSYTYFICFITAEDPSKSIVSITSRGPILNDSEILFFVNASHYYVSFIADGNHQEDFERNENKEASLLKHKTLLLPDYIAQVSESELKSAYSYTAKVVSEQELIELMKQKNPDYAYVFVCHVKMTTTGSKFIHYVLDCESGRPLLIYKQDDVQLIITDQRSFLEELPTLREMVLSKNKSALFKHRFIKSKELKAYTSIVEGKSEGGKKKGKKEKVNTTEG